MRPRRWKLTSRDAHVRLIRSGFRCPGCGREGVAVYGEREREIAGLPVGRTRLVLHVTAHRIYCPGCGATHYERFPFTPSQTARMTRQMELTVLELRREMSVSAVAGHFGLSWHTVKNIEKLEPDEAAALAKARGLCKPLSDAYMLKEKLRSIYASAEGEPDAAVLLEEWCALADGTGLPEMAAMAKTVRRHFSGILAFWRHGGLTNASQEGFNNKIRWLIGQAYGFRDYEYFRLKIFDLPSTNIRKAI